MQRSRRPGRWPWCRAEPGGQGVAGAAVDPDREARRGGGRQALREQRADRGRRGRRRCRAVASAGPPVGLIVTKSSPSVPSQTRVRAPLSTTTARLRAASSRAARDADRPRSSAVAHAEQARGLAGVRREHDRRRRGGDAIEALGEVGQARRRRAPAAMPAASAASTQPWPRGVVGHAGADHERRLVGGERGRTAPVADQRRGHDGVGRRQLAVAGGGQRARARRRRAAPRPPRAGRRRACRASRRSRATWPRAALVIERAAAAAPAARRRPPRRAPARTPASRPARAGSRCRPRSTAPQPAKPGRADDADLGQPPCVTVRWAAHRDAERMAGVAVEPRRQIDRDAVAARGVDRARRPSARCPSIGRGEPDAEQRVDDERRRCRSLAQLVRARRRCSTSEITPPERSRTSRWSARVAVDRGRAPRPGRRRRRRRRRAARGR